MELEDWLVAWQKGDIGFHKPCVNVLLETNINKVVCGREGVRFFFPLCGKAVDIKWLADMGHTVVGVEICDTAIRQFFEEQGLSYNEEAVPALPGTKLFKSTDGKISLYQCDIQLLQVGHQPAHHCLVTRRFAIEGRFGGIWDRGSLVAINPCDREKYANLMLSLMDNDCRYLLDTLEYNPELYKGPPFYVSDEQIRNLYGLACDIEKLQSVDPLTDAAQEMGLDSLLERVYLLKPKTW